MEQDYHQISVSIAEVFATVKAPMSDDQRMLLAGAIAPWLEQRDSRIAELEKGMRELMRGYVNTLENARDRIVLLGGKCDPVGVMESGDPHLRQARTLMVGSHAQ
jgi:predicted transcriptional regulator